MNKLALGTAQFGMNYGINNKTGKIPPADVLKILRKAISSGIDTVDTACSYGDSENRIGDFIKSNNAEFRIVSKLPACGADEVEKIVKRSLKNLNVSKIYGYLVHDYNSYLNDSGIWSELKRLQGKGMIDKVGFSVYLPSELETLLGDDLEIDIMQMPFSIFDCRFFSYLTDLKELDIEVHARSLFLQGLVFKDAADLDPYFGKISDKFTMLGRLVSESNISKVSLCLNFVIANKLIDKAVIGLDSLNNLEELIQAAGAVCLTEKLLSDIDGLAIDDEDMLVPYNWRHGKGG